MLEMKIGHLIREGKIVACSHSQKLKLKLHPDYFEQIVTRPKDLPHGAKNVVFVGEMTDEERVLWRAYLEANPTIWTTS